MLDYPVGPMSSQGSSKVEEGDRKVESETEMTTEEWSERCNTAGFEERRRDHEPRVPSRSWTGKGMDSPLEPLEGNAALPAPLFFLTYKQ